MYGRQKYISLQSENKTKNFKLFTATELFLQFAL